MAKLAENEQDGSLYERDFYAWLNDQAAKLRARSHKDIDWDNIAEELESVGRSDKRELVSRLALLVHHLLKWEFQPGRRSESWRTTISEQRIWVPGILRSSPSLKSHLEAAFKEAYQHGRREAINETGLRPAHFPDEPGFSVEQALDGAFWPGESVAPSDLWRD